MGLGEVMASNAFHILGERLNKKNGRKKDGTSPDDNS